jgi:hypothetical protein
MTTEAEFEKHMAKLADHIKKETEGKYNPTRLREMVNERGGVETARYLIHKDEVSDGYTKLWGLERLDLTVEAQILENNKWHCLFTEDELKKCRHRLKEYKYELKE